MKLLVVLTLLAAGCSMAHASNKHFKDLKQEDAVKLISTLKISSSAVKDANCNTKVGKHIMREAAKLSHDNVLIFTERAGCTVKQFLRTPKANAVFQSMQDKEQDCEKQKKSINELDIVSRLTLAPILCHIADLDVDSLHELVNDLLNGLLQSVQQLGVLNGLGVSSLPGNLQQQVQGLLGGKLNVCDQDGILGKNGVLGGLLVNRNGLLGGLLVNRNGLLGENGLLEGILGGNGLGGILGGILGDGRGQ